MKKRSLLALAMVGALSVSMLAGCGSSSTKETQAPAGSEAATEAATEAAKESTAAGDGKVYYLNFKPEQDAQWQELAKLYTEETGVPVTVLTAASGNYETTLKSEMAKTDAPTLFQVNGPVGLASWKDYCYDLKDSKIAGELTNDEFALMDGDSMAGIGYVIETYGIIYNKALLEKAGYTQDDIKSFDTMLEKGKVSFPLSNSWYIQAFYVANGCTLFGDGTDEAAGVDFSGDKAATVTKYLVDLCKNPNFINDADGAGIAGLRDGSVNAIFSGTWDAESVKEALGDNMGVAALPTVNIGGTEGQMKSFVGSKAIGVNPNAENMQVAMSLAAFLAGENAQKDHYDMRNILPTNINIAIADDPIATAVTKVMTDTSIMQPLVSTMGNYWSPAENMGKALVAGEITADNAAEKTEAMNTAMNTDAAQ